MLRACDLRVKDVMTPSPQVVDIDATIGEAYTLLVGERLSAVPVVDPLGNAVGVLSMIDLVVDLAPALDPQAPPDGEALDGLKRRRVGAKCPPDGLVTVEPEVCLTEACRLMVKNKVHRVLVTEGSRPVGVVSSIDVVRALSALEEVNTGGPLLGEERGDDHL